MVFPRPGVCQRGRRAVHAAGGSPLSPRRFCPEMEHSRPRLCGGRAVRFSSVVVPAATGMADCEAYLTPAWLP